MRSQPRNRKQRPPRRGWLAFLAALGIAGVAFADAPLPFREYPGYEYFFDVELPTDYREPAEWVFGRLMYPSIGWGSGWENGGTSWTIDYPKGDRHIAALVRRLSIIDARSVEQPVNLDDGDDVFNWPWLYAVEVGQWDLTDAQAAQLREYLLRGGFLMVDDFHGSQQWTIFVESMRRVFPDRPIVDLPDDDPIFHTFWDLEDREQIPGLRYVYTGQTFEEDGFDAHWRGIYDDQGRVMVAICHNMDLGDAVEHSDTPEYPQEWSATAMRTFLNYIIYAMTH
jgi:hypothetical protein